MDFSSWAIVGALIGALAAQKRGHNIAVGILAGIILGPFAVLLFAVSGIFSSSESMRCPFCAERIRPEAIVCPHCRKDLVRDDSNKVHSVDDKGKQVNSNFKKDAPVQ